MIKSKLTLGIKLWSKTCPQHWASKAELLSGEALCDSRNKDVLQASTNRIHLFLLTYNQFLKILLDLRARMCNPAVIPSYEKTLATINNKTKGWLIVPFQVPQGVQNKKNTSKLKITSPLPTTGIQSLKRSRKNVNGCREACKNVQWNSCVVKAPRYQLPAGCPVKQPSTARTRSAPWPPAPHRGRSWSTSRCSASSASSPAQAARWR